MSRFYGKFGMLMIGALALSALAVTPAAAGGSRTTTTTTPKCVVTPNPVTNSATITVSGSGFSSGMIVNLYISDAVSTWIVYGGNVAGGTVSKTGTFSIGGINSGVYYPANLGQKTVAVVNALDRRTKTLAQCTFTVQ